MTIPYKRVHVIVNPAAGQNEAILNTLNAVFYPHGIDWQVSITHKFGDATRLVRQAMAEGVDLIAGYGGDGTQMEIANGVMGGNTPMAILPGGTGNAMAFELKIPRRLRQAAELICRSHKQQKIDLGQIEDRQFMLRVYTGPGKEAVASREEKDKLGVLAYPLASMRVLKNLKKVNYRLTIDGHTFEDEGVMCYIFNAGAWGGIQLPDANVISADDGRLDVLIMDRSIKSIQEFTSFEINAGFAKKHVHHWQGKEIVVETDSPQTVWVDGEAHGQTPFTAVVLPQAVKIVVP